MLFAAKVDIIIIYVKYFILVFLKAIFALLIMFFLKIKSYVKLNL